VLVHDEQIRREAREGRPDHVTAQIDDLPELEPERPRRVTALGLVQGGQREAVGSGRHREDAGLARPGEQQHGPARRPGEGLRDGEIASQVTQPLGVVAVEGDPLHGTHDRHDRLRV